MATRRKGEGSIRTFGGGFRHWRPHKHPRGAGGRFIDTPDYYVPPSTPKKSHNSAWMHVDHAPSWEQTRPWQHSSMEEKPERWKVETDPKRQSRPLYLAYNDVVITPAYFELSEEARRHTWYQQIAESSSIYPNFNEEEELWGPGAPYDNAFTNMDITSLNGAVGKSEVYAEAYAILADGDAAELDRLIPGLAPMIRREAIAKGLPIDDGLIAGPYGEDNRFREGIEPYIPSSPEMDAYKNDEGEIDWEAYRVDDDEFKRELHLLVSEGRIPPEDAEAVQLLEGRAENWIPLPDNLWHVTTALSAIEKDGVLKTRQELDMRSGTGLGSGPDTTISFTDDYRIAETIYASMLEANGIASGETTMRQLMEKDAQGAWGLEPGAVTEKWLTGQYGWKKGDPLPAVIEGGLDGPSDKAWDIYNQFAWARDFAGGPMYPLFMSTDWKALGAKDPAEDISIIRVKPNVPEPRQAMGYRVSALGEIRTMTGSIVDIDGMYDQPESLLALEADQPAEATFSGSIDFDFDSPNQKEIVTALGHGGAQGRYAAAFAFGFPGDWKSPQDMATYLDERGTDAGDVRKVLSTLNNPSYVDDWATRHGFERSGDADLGAPEPWMIMPGAVPALEASFPGMDDAMWMIMGNFASVQGRKFQVKMPAATYTYPPADGVNLNVQYPAEAVTRALNPDFPDAEVPYFPSSEWLERAFMGNIKNKHTMAAATPYRTMGFDIETHSGNGINLIDADGFRDGLDKSGIPPVDAQHMTEAYEGLTEDFPLHGFRGIAGPDHSMWQYLRSQPRNATVAFTTMNQVLGVHPAGIDATHAMERDLDNTGYAFVAAPTVEGFVAHEFAHAMFAAMGTNRAAGEYTQSDAVASYALTEANTAVSAMHAGTSPLEDASFLASEVSTYAESARHEAFAELFSLYREGRSIPSWVKTWGDTFTSAYKRGMAEDELFGHPNFAYKRLNAHSKPLSALEAAEQRREDLIETYGAAFDNEVGSTP